MQYERCKCGKMQSVSSGGEFSPLCVVCPDCKSTLATGPDGHEEPEPHPMRQVFDERTGQFSHYQCRQCGAKEYTRRPNYDSRVQ